MNAKLINRIWGICGMVIGLCTLIVAGSNIIEVTLPDVLIRTIGIIDIIALPVYVFTSVMKWKNGKGEN